MNGSSHPTKTLNAGRTYCTLLFLIIPFIFSSLFLRLSLALLSSAMATQEMNADKENHDGRKMEEEEVEEGAEPAEKDKGRFSEAFCNRVQGVGVIVKCRIARLLLVPNRKIYSRSDGYFSPRQRTQRP